ncbi:DENN domain-containing protein 5A isoform X2 [Frankliniella occidentalis]|uniref:DENN domain-containing protein 5A isoform X2 n=1 Tax=Frankliniella occidentalis TaxID=133901 RepID=A0A9C6U0E4_FRAOC|nr:DENN domain-containing protein 5A isoform X2 [Frankliniella occidentalis]
MAPWSLLSWVRLAWRRAGHASRSRSFPPPPRAGAASWLSHCARTYTLHALHARTVKYMRILCLPQGLLFRTQKHSVAPKFHSFVITREDGSRTYGASYVFFEEVRNKKICTAMQTLQAMHLTELSEGVGRTKGVAEQNASSRSLPRHFKLSGHHPKDAQSYYDATKDTLFVTKSIALLGQLPYVKASQLFLSTLHRYVMMGGAISGGLSTESYVYNLLYEIMVPLPGRSSRISCFPPTLPSLGSDPALIIQRPSSIEELPLFDFPLRQVFSLLGANTIVQLFTCVLLENQVMLSSSDYQRLTQVAEALVCLLFPFTWQHVYVPILPASLQHFLDAPVPFVMGLHSCEPRLKMASEANLCYLDIDRCTLQLPEELPSFPQRNEFIAEINEVLRRYDVNAPANGPVDRNLNECNEKPSCVGQGGRGVTARAPAVQSDIMSTSCTLPSGPHRLRRKHSWAQPEKDGDFLPSRPQSPDDGSDALARLVAIAKRTGVHLDGIDSNLNCDEVSDDSHNENIAKIRTEPKTEQEIYADDLRFNNTIREVFLNRFVHIFVAYEKFVIFPSQVKEEEWMSNRESMQNFDKASFLSDQPEQHLPFLSRFIESQMFATLVDNKILSMWGKMEGNLRVFERRIHVIRNRLGVGGSLSRAVGYETAPIVCDSTLLLEKRLSSVDIIAAKPQEILPQTGGAQQSRPSRAHNRVRSFALLDSSVLNPQVTYRSKKRSSVQLRPHRKERERHNSTSGSNSSQSTSNVTENLNDSPNRTQTIGPFDMKHSSSQNSLNCESVCNSASVSAQTSPTSSPAGDSPLQSDNQTKPPVSSVTSSGDIDGNLSKVANRQSKIFTSDPSPAVIAQTNWTFVETMLSEIRSRTKRMLLEKMGTEAVELGHGGEGSIVGVEENTLIAGLCDLLERVWSHGLHNKQGKSAVWSHLLSYQEKVDIVKPTDPSFLTPVDISSKSASTASPIRGLSRKLFFSGNSPSIFDVASFLSKGRDLHSMALEPDSSPNGRGRSERCRSLDRKQSPAERKSLGLETQPTSLLKPLPVSVTFDMRNVQSMTDIKTHIGYARAWVRLSLEKKLLSKHLRTLLSDTSLLKTHYKRYAFLRCEEEREQFLYHLLSLNAVDYLCFTNTYTTTKMPYRVVIFPSRKYSAATTSANSWVQVAGSIGESNQVPVPRGHPEFVFQHKNLGVLTTLRIGHDNSGLSPKWMVEYVLVRNEMTGHTYKFPCGRWLGRGIDDGSTERLLIGELIPNSDTRSELAETCSTPPRCRSPSLPRDNRKDIKPSVPEIQHMLGDCVNNIVKLHYRRRSQPQARDNSSLTILLCGEMGLVSCLEQAFLVGFKSARLFGKNLYLWDYFVRVREQFSEEQPIPVPKGRVQQQRERLERMERAERAERWDRGRGAVQERRPLVDQNSAQRETLAGETRLAYSELINNVDQCSHTLGKDGKFQLFICLAARDHILSRMIPELSAAKVTLEMYEENSFLRDQNLLTTLHQLLASLDEFDIVLENSITKGVGR